MCRGTAAAIGQAAGGWWHAGGSAGRQRAKWLVTLAPLVIVGGLTLFEHVRYLNSGVSEDDVPVHIVLIASILVYAAAVFSQVSRLQQHLERQNQELLSLHRAGVAISGELALDRVLRQIVDQARELIGAQYGVLVIRLADGVQSFVTSGISEEQRCLIGAPPSGRGLLGVALGQGQRLRVADLRRDPRSAGFPPHHPIMRSLLAVPIVAHGQVLGELYLADKTHCGEFSADDEKTLDRFAAQAALIMENARLYRQVGELAIAEERQRLAHEMHDSLAQVLGYVNTKAQAAQELLKREQPARAIEQIGQLVEAAREAYADVREAIFGLRTPYEPETAFVDALRSYLERWQEISGVRVDLDARLDKEVALSLAPTAELQVLRIVQEALANVRKHARATHAWVQVSQTPEWIAVSVKDDGVGFDPASPGHGSLPHFGLATMRERAESVGGTVEIHSTEGWGTEVRLCIPVHAPVAA